METNINAVGIRQPEPYETPTPGRPHVLSPSETVEDMKRRFFRESLPRGAYEKAREHATEEFKQEGAIKHAYLEFTKQRVDRANALRTELLASRKDASERTILEYVHKRLHEEGFSFPGTERLPAIVFENGEAKSSYTPAWSEIKNFFLGIPKGTWQLATAGYRGGLAMGEAVSYAADPGPITNAYTRERLRLNELDKRVREGKGLGGITLKGDEGFITADVASALGEVVPQLSILAGGASAAHKAAMAAKTAKGASALAESLGWGKVATAQAAKVVSHKATAFLNRASAVGSMFALEGAGAYDQYLQYAAEKGIPASEASTQAFVGSLLYAAAASALEYFGPFQMLEKKVPGARKRIIAIALGAGTESGTEALQSLTQEAIAYGLDLRDVTWQNLFSSVKQAAFEGLVGGIAGGTVAGVAWQGPYSADPVSQQEVSPNSPLPPVDPVSIGETAGRTESSLERSDQFVEGSRSVAPSPEAEAAPTEAVRDHARGGPEIIIQEPGAESRATPAPDSEGDPTIERLTQERDEARAEARTDELTGLGNKRQYTETLAKFRQRTDETGQPFSVILLDAAHFKAANTVLGHKGGDRFLRALANSLRGASTGRVSDAVVIRYGGDEFAVILPNTTKRGAEVVNSRIEEACRKHLIPGLSVFLVGQPVTYTPGSDLDTLLVSADKKVESRKERLKEQYGEPRTRSETEAMIAQALADQVTGEPPEASRAVSEAEADAIGSPPMSTQLPEVVQVADITQTIVASEDAMAADPVTDGRDNYPPNPVIDGIKSLLTDEAGAVDPQFMAQRAAGAVASVTDMAVDTAGAIDALVLDEGHALRMASNGGAFATDLFQAADNQSRKYEAEIVKGWDDLLMGIPRRRRGGVVRWMNQLRPDGTTNWATLIERPETVAKETVPEPVKQLVAYYRSIQDVLGDLAVKLKAPQIQMGKDGNWVVGIFKKAKGGRYFRMPTKAGMDAFAYQTGPVWDAYIEWVEQHPELNPRTHKAAEAESVSIRELLTKRMETQAETERVGERKRTGALNFVRVMEAVPQVVVVNGKPVEFTRRKPLNHFRTTTRQQVRELILRRMIQDNLTVRYGEYDEETGKSSYPMKAHPEITDIDGLLDRLRNETIRRSRRSPGRSARLFNRLIVNYNNIPDTSGPFDDFFMPASGKPSAIRSTIRGAYNAVATSMLNLSPLWDALHWTVATAITGKRGFTGFLKGLHQMVTSPKQFDAAYRAMGAVHTELYTDYTLHRDSFLSDLLIKDVRAAGMIVGRFTERRAQYLAARQFDAYVEALNTQTGLGRHDRQILRRICKLNDNQILEVARGEMSPQTRVAAIQNGTAAVQGLTESAINKGWIQNNPVARVMLPFLSVITATTRLTRNVVSGLVDDIRDATDRSQPQNIRAQAAVSAAQTGLTLMALAVAFTGKGAVSRYLRRALKREPMVDPEDPENWATLLAECMVEGGVFGPFYRLFESVKYSDGNLYEAATKLIFPAGVLCDVGSALTGMGHYEGTPWARRLQSLAARYSPLYKVIRNQWTSLVYPSRGRYNRARKHVRAWQVSQGEDPYRGGRGAPTNYHYYRVFETIRDGNYDDIDEALAAYKTWAKEQGRTGEKARTGLRSSLRSRQPINLAAKRQKAFLKSLKPELRRELQAENKRYNAIVDRITRKPGVLPRPPSPPSPPKPTSGGSWYAG